MQLRSLDCRNLSTRQAGLAILEAYNAARDGSEFSASVDSLDAGLRMWLIEAGAKHRFEEDDAGGWRLTIRRRLSPGQGTVPGLHHVAVNGSDVWTCERSTRLARIDGPEGQVAQVASVATKASHLAIDRDKNLVFLADPGSDTLLAIDAENLSVQHTWPAPGGPQLPCVTDAGIVCVTGAASGTLTIVRPRRQAYDVQTISVGDCPHDPLFGADGKQVFVPCAGAGTIVCVDLEDGTILGSHAVGDGPAHLALHPDGSKLYAANTFDGTLTCLSVEGDLLARERSGPWAHQPVISPDGKHVFVANFFDDTICVFETAGLQRIKTLETDPYPHGLYMSPNGRWLVATGFASDWLRVYDANSVIEVARIEVGRGSSHVAFLPDQVTAYVACSVDDHLARLDLAAMTCTQRIRLPDANGAG
jgi:YVTN family beta-propeller protein